MRGYRRLVFAAIVMLASYAGLWFGKLSGQEIIDLWQWIGLAYLGSDGVEKAADAWKEKAKSDESGEP